jgi:hypothetical protein
MRREVRGVRLSEATCPGWMPRRHDDDGDVDRYAPQELTIEEQHQGGE